MDKPTTQRIERLHPTIREEVAKIIEQCDEALTGKAKVRITQGFRTPEEQEILYAQGRTSPGKKVTNAKGGRSIHNYGFAMESHETPKKIEKMIKRQLCKQVKL